MNDNGVNNGNNMNSGNNMNNGMNSGNNMNNGMNNANNFSQNVNQAFNNVERGIGSAINDMRNTFTNPNGGGYNSTGYNNAGGYNSGAGYNNAGGYNGGAGYNNAGGYNGGAGYNNAGGYNGGSGFNNGGYNGGSGFNNGGVRLKDDRGLAVYIILSILTCGIYGYYFIYSIAADVNTACDGDGETTGGLAMYIILSILTCGFYSLWWEYKLGDRLAANAPRYGLSFRENGTTILLWHIVGIVLCGIGPFIAMYMLIKNTNQICAAYNAQHGLR